jgi:two-component system, chemotaxis family, chemotaxis protein CheY
MDRSSDLAGLQVLVVDDDETMRALLCRMLRRMKVAGAREAESAEQAFEILAAPQSDIGLVICDWTMPGMSGIELYQQISAWRPGLPFLMLTGRADGDAVATARAAGVRDYILKPVSAQELALKIHALLARDGMVPR